MVVGAADAVRGAASPPEEMAYILSHSRSVGVIAQDTQTLERVLPFLSSGAGSNGASHTAKAQSNGAEALDVATTASSDGDKSNGTGIQQVC